MSNLLSNLSKTVSRKNKRLGRGTGSRKGAKSGRGTTRHQKARENIPLHFEGGQGKITKKYPLLRGKGKNKPVSSKPYIITLSDLNIYDNGETVTTETLLEKGIVDKKVYLYGVKLLNMGKLEKKLIIKIPHSKSVKVHSNLII